MAEEYNDPNIDWALEEERARLTGAGGGTPGAGMFDPKKKMKRPMTLDEILLAQAPFGAKQKLLAEQLKMADELRGTAMPGMRDVGRYKIAAGGLETLGAAANKGLGIYGRGRGMQEQDALTKEGLGSLSDLLKENKLRRDEYFQDTGTIPQGYWG